MMEKATMVLLAFLTFMGLYILVCEVVVIFITKKIEKWLKR